MPPQLHGNTAGIGVSTTPPVSKEYKAANYRAMPRDTTLLLTDAKKLEADYLRISDEDPLVAILLERDGQKFYAFPVVIYDIPGAKYTIELGDGRTESIWTPAAPNQVTALHTFKIEGGTWYYLVNNIPFGREVGGKGFMRVRVSDGK
jgi:hypothetical protein